MIGLWSDAHNFPNLPLMKIARYLIDNGEKVQLYNENTKYDKIYCSKTFSFTDDIKITEANLNTNIIKGGSGYCIKLVDGKEIYNVEYQTYLPDEIEHIYPYYDLYDGYDYALGFLTRGCPRGCDFCIVAKKEGKKSRQVATLDEFYTNQKAIKLLDANILACKEHEKLLEELAQTKAQIDFTQGLDIRLTNKDNIELLNKINTPVLYFAWDNPKQDLKKYFENFSKYTKIHNRRRLVVYVLTNFDSTIDEDLYRIYTLRELGFNPYVMIYDKEHCDNEHKKLQRWVNNRIIWNTVLKFEDYKA